MVFVIVESGHRFENVPGVDEPGLLDEVGTEDRNGHRHFLEILLTFSRRDDDLLQCRHRVLSVDRRKG